jgi:hypothetical protein
MNDFSEKWTDSAARKVMEIIEQAVAEEREACARVADEWRGPREDDLDVAEEIGYRIRQRGKQTGSVDIARRT